MCESEGAGFKGYVGLVKMHDPGNFFFPIVTQLNAAEPGIEGIEEFTTVSRGDDPMDMAAVQGDILFRSQDTVFGFSSLEQTNMNDVATTQSVNLINEEVDGWADEEVRPALHCYQRHQGIFTGRG